MNSMESILNVMDKKYSKSNESYSDNSYNSKLSVESFISRDVAEKNPDLVRDLKKIINDKSTSMEHYKNTFNKNYNDSIMMTHIWNRSVQQRFKKVRFIKNLINANTDKSREAANDMIHMMSIESEGNWFKRAIDGIIRIVKKMYSAIISFGKSVINFIRSKIASLDNKFYEDNKGRIAGAIKSNGDEKIKYRMYKIGNANNDIFKYLSDVENDMKSFETIIDQNTEFAKNKDKFNTTRTAALFVNNYIVKMKLGEKLKSQNDVKTEINNLFFSQDEKPQKEEHSIKDLLSTETFEILSKNYLNKLNDFYKISIKMSKTLDRYLGGLNLLATLSRVNKDETKFVANVPSELSEQLSGIENKSAREVFSLRHYIHYYISFVNSMYWEALSYRSTIKKLAKAVLKDTGSSGGGQVTNDPSLEDIKTFFRNQKETLKPGYKHVLLKEGKKGDKYIVKATIYNVSTQSTYGPVKTYHISQDSDIMKMFGNKDMVILT